MNVKSNTFYYRMISCILGLILLAPLSASADVFYYKDIGHIVRLGPNSISIDDPDYVFSPGVKIKKLNGKLISTKDLKIGDYVELNIMKLDGKYLVKSINFLPTPTD
jgi:hypothetical protein